jgi:hypothetical protein
VLPRNDAQLQPFAAEFRRRTAAETSRSYTLLRKARLVASADCQFPDIWDLHRQIFTSFIASFLHTNTFTVVSYGKLIHALINSRPKVFRTDDGGSKHF